MASVCAGPALAFTVTGIDMHSALQPLFTMQPSPRKRLAALSQLLGNPERIAEAVGVGH